MKAKHIYGQSFLAPYQPNLGGPPPNLGGPPTMPPTTQTTYVYVADRKRLYQFIKV